jgi:peptidoglycan hydrolase-like protein with peptidoglycan-binding domain
MKYDYVKRSAVGGMLALTLLTAAAPIPRAEAATIQELQAQIQALMEKLQALNGTNASSVCTQFTTDLTVGRTGTDVTRLQQFLINRSHIIPAGATGYFGEQTRKALVEFQSQHSISPAVGYFGPMTRSKVNALCTATTPTNPGNGTGTTTPPTGGLALDGEASFEKFDVTDGDTTSLEENQKNITVMEVKFDVEDGDARVNRIDIGFTPDVGNDEKRPWRVFTEIGVYDGSKLLKKIDATNRNNWRENNPTSGSYMLRLSSIDWVVKEGETAEFVVKVSTARNIDGTNNGEVWNVFVPTDGIRALDASRTTVMAGDTTDFVTLDIDRGGSSDELIVRRSNDDPKSTILQLDDNNRSGFMTVFAFDLDTDDSKNDIEIRKLPVQLTVSSGTVATFMRDARLVIDGQTFTKKTVVDGATNTMTFEFDRGELVLDGGDRVTAVLEVDFRALSLGNEGVTITGAVQTAGIVAEGSDDLTGSQLSGTASGETHVMRTKGMIGTADSVVGEVITTSGALNDYATFSIKVDVTAFGQDVYIPVNVSAGATYQLENNAGAAIGDTGTAVLTVDTTEENGYFRIPEGETKKLTLDVTYLPGTPMTAVRLQLLGINYGANAAAPTDTWNATPASRYETPTKTIVN